MTPLASTLARYRLVTGEDLRWVDGLPVEEAIREPGASLYEEGRPSPSAYVVLSGMICCHRDLPDGGRQVSEILIPGNLCGLHAALGQPMDHAATAVTRARVLAVPNATMASLMSNPRVAATLWRVAREEAATLRAHLAAIGRLDARARVACLITELHARHEAAGLCSGPALRLALTQTMVADTLGLTPVHVGRVLRTMHKARILRIERGGFVVLRPAAIRAIGGLEGEAVPALPVPSRASLPGLARPALPRAVAEAGGLEHAGA